MKTTRVFTPTRIIALAVIGVLVLGLAYLRVAPGLASVTVPEGAKAGELTMHPCTHATEAGALPADCGTLVVPENRADPDSRLIALPVTRIPAKSDNPAEPIFALWGGPGITNMDWPQTSRFVDNHDVVLVGYRGLDGSVRLDCPEVESTLAHQSDFLAEEAFRAYGNAYRSCADRLTNEGTDLAGYGLVPQIDDLEAARLALGYDRVNLLSESAGTRRAMVYAWRYPESIHRSVMIAVNPPGHFLWSGQATDEQILRYADLCSKDAACNRRTDDLAASMRQIAADIPQRWLFLPIQPGNVRVASFTGFFETSTEAAASAPEIIDSWLSAAEGDASGLWFMSFFVDLFFPKLFVWGEFASIGVADAEVEDAYYAAGVDQGSILGNPGTDWVFGGGRLGEAWPANPDDAQYGSVRTSEVETLLVGGELDVSTPPQFARDELLPYLPKGHQVVLSEFGHTADFWTYQPEASTRLITSFFDTGRVDDSLYEPHRVDFTPETTQTLLAKQIVGAMGGLALVTVLSLLWMARRVRQRGGIGPRAGAVLRSVYPVVLGLGGWLLGVLIVMTAMPTVPLDDELLVGLSVGLPIGLGIYFPWVNRDWSAKTKATGFAAAVAGALIGAWLGFNASEGFVALLTSIAGAAVGANLILIILDISRDRSEHRLAPPSHVDPERQSVRA